MLIDNNKMISDELFADIYCRFYEFFDFYKDSNLGSDSKDTSKYNIKYLLDGYKEISIIDNYLDHLNTNEKATIIDNSTNDDYDFIPDISESGLLNDNITINTDNNMIMFKISLYLQKIMESYQYMHKNIIQQYFVDAPRTELYYNYDQVTDINEYINKLLKFRSYDTTINNNKYPLVDIIIMLCNQSSYAFPFLLMNKIYNNGTQYVFSGPTKINIVDEENTNTNGVITKNKTNKHLEILMNVNFHIKDISNNTNVNSISVDIILNTKLNKNNVEIFNKFGMINWSLKI